LAAAAFAYEPQVIDNVDFKFKAVCPVNNAIIYEQPLNERVRTFLRLEYLFQHLHASMVGPSV